MINILNYLTTNGLAKTLSEARRKIMQGAITVNGSVCDNPGQYVKDTDKVENKGLKIPEGYAYGKMRF